MAILAAEIHKWAIAMVWALDNDSVGHSGLYGGKNSPDSPGPVAMLEEAVLRRLALVVDTVHVPFG